jgi:hypothetical protein
MQDINLPVKPVNGFPDNDFTFPAKSIMIRVGEMSNDMSTVKVYCETAGVADFAPPVITKTNFTYTWLVLPLDFIKNAKSANGVKRDETNLILSAFKLQLDMDAYAASPSSWTQIEIPATEEPAP